MEKAMKNSTRYLHLAIAAAIVIIFYFIPTQDLSFEGKMAFGLMLAGIYLWITGPMPMGISAIGLMLLLPAFGIMDYAGVWSNFISSVIFFVLASFAITAALLKTRIPAKLMFMILSFSKGKPKLIVLGFIASCALCSTVISDLPCTAVFSGLAASTIIASEGCVPGKSNLARCIMIGIPFGSLFGGMMTPVSTAMNMLILGYLESITGVTISFPCWMLMALPFTVLGVFVSWLVLTTIFKPEPIKESTKTEIINKAREIGPLGMQDKKVLGILILIFTCWFAGNWTGWNSTAISVIGMVCLFLPGINALSWKDFETSVSWGVIMLIGGIQSIAAGIVNQGGSSWLVGSLLGKLAISTVALVAGTAIAFPLLRVVIPAAPALIALMTPSLFEMSTTLGTSPVIIAMTIVCTSATFLNGIDTGNLVAYRYGYFSIIDFFLAGLLPTLLIVLLCVFWLPLIVPILF